ncbi:MAG: porin family protein [Bacteroidetes bacterium]|nr:porin family protein [Bacteroidota bacterium]
MKKILKAAFLIIMVLFITNSQIKAQDEISKTRFGIKGGINKILLYTNNAYSTKMISTFHFGLFAKFTLSHSFAIQPEINYSPKGGEITYNDLLLNGSVRFNYNYLEVPLLIVYNLFENCNIQAGPYAAFLISNKVSNVSGGNLFDFEKNINKSNNSHFDAGFAAGLSIDIGKLGMGIRYSYGFIKVAKESSVLDTFYTIPSAHNAVTSFYLSFSIN